MSDKTKAVNLTEDEISAVLTYHGTKLTERDFSDSTIERINYLNKRLKSFKELETEVKSDNSTAGWGTQQNG